MVPRGTRNVRKVQAEILKIDGPIVTGITPRNVGVWKYCLGALSPASVGGNEDPAIGLACYEDVSHLRDGGVCGSKG